MRLPIAFSILTLTACSTLEGGDGARAPAALAHNFSAQKNLVYSPPGWPQELKADVYAPRGLGPHAGVLVLHGGLWDDGERTDMADICKRLAEKGFAAITIDYRLAPAHPFPAALHDVQMAMRWLHARAEGLNVDAERLGVFGYAGGGHLAALLGTLGENDALDMPHGGPQTRARAVVAGAAPTDLRKLADRSPVSQFLGSGLEQAPELYARASPVNYVSPSDAPFFLYHGTLDTTVPADQAQDMRAALEAVGVNAQILRLTGMTHALAFLFDGDALDRAVDFLDRHLRARAF